MPDLLNIVCPHCNAVNQLPLHSLKKDPKCGKCGDLIFTGYPIVLESSNFQKHISRNDIPVIVNFWASWSEDCRLMSPAFALAASRVEPRIRLAKINKDTEQEVATRLAILSVPTLVLFKKGKEIDRAYEVFDIAGLLKWIKTHALARL
ncbi:MAG: thioredoxin domain-containing protein [Thermodesulfovibrionales bacterium]